MNDLIVENMILIAYSILETGHLEGKAVIMYNVESKISVYDW